MKLYRKTTIEKATIEARHFKEANDDPFWLEPYEPPTEEEIIAVMNEARYEKHIHQNGNTIYPHLAGYNFKKVAKAITKLIKRER